MLNEAQNEQLLSVVMILDVNACVGAVEGLGGGGKVVLSAPHACKMTRSDITTADIR